MNGRPLDAETRLLYAQNLTAFVQLFAAAMSVAAFHSNTPSLGKDVENDAWEGLRRVAEEIYDHQQAIYRAVDARAIAVEAPDVSQEDEQ